MTLPCVCGHPETTHEHYRPGSDCGACGRDMCPEYRPAHPSGWDEGQIAIKIQQAAIQRMADLVRLPDRVLAVLAACLLYAVRADQAVEVVIPEQRGPHRRDATTPGAPPALWPVRRGVRHPFAGGHL